MIFVITPCFYDFQAICERKGIKIKYNFNKAPCSANVKWINSYSKLMENTHMPSLVLYGTKFENMGQHDIYNIMIELQKRKKND